MMKNIVKIVRDLAFSRDLTISHRALPVGDNGDLVPGILFSGKGATGVMVSHNKEADQTVKTQHFPAGKTLTEV